MGYSNATRAIDTWGPVLDARPMVVLIRMAHMAHDQHRVLRFYGGWTILATAAGQRVPVGCEKCRGCKACNASQRAVERAVASLVRARAITRERRGRRGHAAEFRLWLDGPAPVDDALFDRPPGP